MHDELVLDVVLEECGVIPELIKMCMKSVVDYQVPLEVDAGLRDNWQEIS